MIGFAKRIGALAALGAVALGGAGRAVEPSGPPPEMSGWRAVTVASGIEHPWGLTWLLDGRPLVTAKNGTLHVLTGGRFHRIPIQGLPPVFTGGQGGLMDIALHPKYRDNRLVYMTMSTGTESQNRTILVRGTFNGHRVSNVETLFRATPVKSGGQHFGSRLLWLPDGTLLMSVGDGGNPPARIGGILARENGQRRDRHLGKILRFTENGQAAEGNPYLGQPHYLGVIYSYGHRNIQGMALDRGSGRVWANEHGPRGGDELNLIRKGANYGWPRATFGRDYRTGEPIGETSIPGMEDPKVAWVPAHPPSGLAFYTGDKAPEWRGSLFSGGLASQDIRRIRLDGENVVGQDRLRIGRRIRDVRQGPDGYLYALTDESNGRLLRIEPTT